MNEGWKQVWSDIVNSVRGAPAPTAQPQEPETRVDALNETPVRGEDTRPLAETHLDTQGTPVESAPAPESLNRTA